MNINYDELTDTEKVLWSILTRSEFFSQDGIKSELYKFAHQDNLNEIITYFEERSC